MSQIVFFANNPGGLKALLPVFNQLPESNLYITEQVKTQAKESYKEILPYETASDKIEETIRKEQPQIVILGTSVATALGGKLENEFIHVCRKLGIKTLSILDHWCHYAQRYTRDTYLDSLPDFIAVMDEKAKQDMISIGFPESKLVITGQPAFDSLLIDAHSRENILNSRSEHFPVSQEDLFISFISEPVLEDYGNARGYNQHEVLEQLGHVLSQIPRAVVALKTHPREGVSFYADFVANHENYFITDAKPRDIVLASDLVIGMTSVLLIESAIMGIPTISFQPGLSADSPYVSMMQPIKVCFGIQELEQILANRKHVNQLGFPYHETQACNNLIKFIKSLLP